MAKPIYTPPEKIQTGLYTSGKEWMFLDTNQEHIGLYHRYPNGAVYSEADFNEFSQELISYAPAIETEFGGVYYNLTQKRFDKYVDPNLYQVIPTESDYEKAFITRYFVQQRNNLSQIIEINAKSYSNVNNKNQPGIDAGRYRKIAINWSIRGPIDDVREANRRALTASGVFELSHYLNNLIEFYKQ
jgi:hypothetical protein